MAFEASRGKKRKKKQKTSGERSPNSVDMKVGDNIRLLRLAGGLTLDELGAELGLSHQQLQKYETGVNRISAGRLWDISVVLDVPIAEFFMGVKQ